MANACLLVYLQFEFQTVLPSRGQFFGTLYTELNAVALDRRYYFDVKHRLDSDSWHIMKREFKASVQEILQRYLTFEELILQGLSKLLLEELSDK